MASGGSSGRSGGGPGSRAYGFGSDDVLCSYDDYEVSNGSRSDQAVKDFHENRMGRPSVNKYNQQEDYSKEDMISAVEKCMKKYADNLLRFLEGISGRLSQLEVYCYKLERSIGELRCDISREQSEVNGKLKSLEKHLQEVHRSVQILRDKQELAETQKELTKLQLPQNVSPSSSHSKLNEGNVAPTVSESQKQNGIQDVPDQHLALALSHQVPVPNSVTALASSNGQQDHYTLNQSGTYYPYQSNIHYMQGPKVQNPSLQPPPLPPPQQEPHLTNQAQPQRVPQYPHQWPQQSSQQFPQRAVQPSQPITQAQIKSHIPPDSSPYPSHQPITNSLPDSFPGSSTMQSSYTAIPPSAGAHPEAVPFSYGASVHSHSQPPPPPRGYIMQQPQQQPSQGSVGANMIKTGYVGTAAYAPVLPQPSIQGYGIMYSIDGGRGAHPLNFNPGSYPPSNVSGHQGQQLPPGSSVSIHHPGSHSQLMLNHPYAEIIEKAVGMGYARDHVLTVVHRMEESGQPIDFNTMLDRLNSRASVASPATWSG